MKSPAAASTAPADRRRSSSSPGSTITGLLDEIAINGYWAGAYASRSTPAAPARERPAADARPRRRQRALRSRQIAAPRRPNLGALGRRDLLDQHALAPQRPLRARVTGAPRVLLAILAKQKEEMLPLYLECIEALDYPKSPIVLYIRTNNNTDGTERILREWVERVGPSTPRRVRRRRCRQTGPTVRRARVERHALSGARQIRNISLQRARRARAATSTSSPTSTISSARPTLRELVALNLPIVSPLLRSLEPGRFYSNYHAEVDEDGYFRSCDQYLWILNQMSAASSRFRSSTAPIWSAPT